MFSFVLIKNNVYLHSLIIEILNETRIATYHFFGYYYYSALAKESEVRWCAIL